MSRRLSTLAKRSGVSLKEVAANVTAIEPAKRTRWDAMTPIRIMDARDLFIRVQRSGRSCLPNLETHIVAMLNELIRLKLELTQPPVT